MQWQIPHAIGLRGACRVSLEEGIDDVLSCLEGTRRVEGEVAAVVYTGCLLGKLGSLI